MERLIKRCVGEMIHCGVIEQRQTEVIAYGLELLFSSVLNLFSIMFMGVCLDKGVETFWLLVVYIPLQSFGGGYHCQTHLRCWLFMVAEYLVSMYCLTSIPGAALWCAGILVAGCFWWLAPVENEKAPFGDAFRKEMHRIVIMVYTAAMAWAVIGCTLHARWMEAVLVAVNLSGLSILWAKVRQKKEERT